MQLDSKCIDFAGAIVKIQQKIKLRRRKDAGCHQD